MKKLLCIGLSVLFLLSFAIIGAAESTTVNGCNWMSILRDDASLADISMPGTHDTAATYVAFGVKARTQHKTIPEQLNCGARFFDIRLANDKGNLKLVHNFINCRKGSGFTAPKLYFEDAIGYCIDFLQKNTQECIVMFIKRDSGDSEGFDELVRAGIEKNAAFWYTENRIPTLGEVRGKIVLMNRFSSFDTALDDSTGGVNLTNFPGQGEKEGSFAVVSLDAFGGDMISTYTVQDRYNYPKKDKWEKAVVPTLEIDKVSGELLINFLSTASGISPEVNARYINANIIGHSLDKNRCYGAVLFDFIDEALAEKIYSCNAAVTDSARTPAAAVPAEVPAAKHGFIRFLDGLWAKIVDDFSK